MEGAGWDVAGRCRRACLGSRQPAVGCQVPNREVPRPADSLTGQRLLALFAAGLLLLNFPLLALWDHAARVAGLPLFPLALFGLWALLIAVLAWLMEAGTDAGPD